MSRDGPRDDPPTANSFSNVGGERRQKELCLTSIICKSDDLRVLCDANLGGSIRLEKEIILDYWCLFGEKAIRSLYINGVLKYLTAKIPTRLLVRNSLHTADLNAVYR